MVSSVVLSSAIISCCLSSVLGSFELGLLSPAVLKLACRRTFHEVLHFFLKGIQTNLVVDEVRPHEINHHVHVIENLMWVHIGLVPKEQLRHRFYQVFVPFRAQFTRVELAQFEFGDCLFRELELGQLRWSAEKRQDGLAQLAVYLEKSVMRRDLITQVRYDRLLQQVREGTDFALSDLLVRLFPKLSQLLKEAGNEICSALVLLVRVQGRVNQRLEVLLSDCALAAPVRGLTCDTRSLMLHRHLNLINNNPN